jgi:hypothetical protein
MMTAVLRSFPRYISLRILADGKKGNPMLKKLTPKNLRGDAFLWILRLVPAGGVCQLQGK